MAVTYTSPNASDPLLALQSEITNLQNEIAAATWPPGQQSKILLLKQRQDEFALALMNAGRLPASAIIAALSITAPTNSDLGGRVTAAAKDRSGEQAHLQQQLVQAAIASSQVTGAQILQSMT